MDTQTQEVMFSSKSDEWATPQALFDKLNHTHNFTLDPCASAQTAKCSKYFTKDDDGLSQSWAGENVFINPPYSNVAGWVEKAYKESVENAATCVLLIPSRTDTKWFHRYCMQADVVQFIKGRVKFENGFGKPNSAPFPSMIIVFDGKSTQTSPQMTGFIL